MAKKVELDYKTITPSDMMDFAKDNLNEEQKKEFAEVALSPKKSKDGTEKKTEKPEFNKSKAKNWLYDNCAELIEWKNPPKRGNNSGTIIETLTSWLK